MLDGEYQLISGATLLKEYAIDVEEDLMIFPRGLVIEIGNGGVTLRGVSYKQSTLLKVVNTSGDILEIQL